MFKRIAAVTLMFGAAVVATPAIGSAQEFRGGFHSGYNRDREFRERERAREIRERVERDRFREARRGYYDRFGCWHRY